MTPSTTPQGFAYAREQFQQIIEDTLAIARGLGASDAAAEVSEGAGLSVSVRKGELENVERNRDKSVGVTVYLGQRRGNASTADFSRQALEQTVRAAYDIARFTAEDPAAGLPDEADLAGPDEAALDLDLVHPWTVEAAQAAELAQRCEDGLIQLQRVEQAWLPGRCVGASCKLVKLLRRRQVPLPHGMIAARLEVQTLQQRQAPAGGLATCPVARARR